MARPATPKRQRQRAVRVQEMLQEALDDNKIGMEELARRSLVDRKTLDNYFRGESPSPSFFPTVDIARVLRVPLEDLAFEQEAEE